MKEEKGRECNYMPYFTNLSSKSERDGVMAHEMGHCFGLDEIILINIQSCVKVHMEDR